MKFSHSTFVKIFCSTTVKQALSQDFQGKGGGGFVIFRVILNIISNFLAKWSTALAVNAYKCSHILSNVSTIRNKF